MIFAVATFLCVLASFQWFGGHEDRDVARQIALVQDHESHLIEFYNSTHVDRALQRLKPLPGLEVMIFNLSDVSDAGLANLARQPNLKRLVFHGGRPGVGDEGLAHLTKLRQLEALELTNQRVTDDGLTRLSGSPRLQSLELYYDWENHDSPLGDAALDNLATFTQLRRLTLGGTWFSDSAVDRLRLRLPQCEVNVLPYGREAQGASETDTR